MIQEATSEITVYSDFHVDAFMPEQDAAMGLAEIKGYDTEQDDLIRFPDMGPNNEYHPNHRLELQLGVTTADLVRVGAKSITEVNKGQYDEILFAKQGAIIRTRRGLVGVSIWADWPHMPVEEQEAFVLETAKRYRDLKGKYGVTFVEAGQAISEADTNLFLVLEGLNFITADRYRSQVNELVGAGVRSVNLMYNRSNSLANSETGLTDLGIAVMSELMTGGTYDPSTNKVINPGQRPSVFVDLAHMTPEPRKDAVKLARDLQTQTGQKMPLIYTHGSFAKSMAGDPDFGSYGEIRGLRDDEVDTLIENSWGFGLTFSRPFFSSLDSAVSTVKALYDKHGHIKNVVIGSDSGGTNPTWDIGANTPEGMTRLRERFIMAGLTQEDVHGIYIGNALELIAQK
jgi:microsomal dipeptidase-like Zn-dependent dipeptidase